MPIADRSLESILLDARWPGGACRKRIKLPEEEARLLRNWLNQGATTNADRMRIFTIFDKTFANAFYVEIVYGSCLPICYVAGGHALR